MDEIKEVQQILNNHALPTDNGGFIRDTLDGSKFNEIAQEIVKLLANHQAKLKESTEIKELNDKAISQWSFNYIDNLPKNWNTELDMNLAIKNGMLEALSYPEKYILKSK